MEQTNEEQLPRNPTEAQGLLIKAVYKQFGAESLPLIRDVLGKQGQALGGKIKKKLPDNSLSTVATAFCKSFDPSKINIITISDEKFQIQGGSCPFGLENTSRELCEAVMNIDFEYFKTAVSDRIKMKIPQTIAAGDSICETVYEFKK